MRHRHLFALVLLAASPVFAQRVVILDIEGDKGGKLRNQVESALKRADTVELVPLDKYKAAAGKKKLKGPSAMTPAALSRVAKSLKIDAGVGGELRKKFEVQIWDAGGQQLWTKELKVKNGMLSSDFASKLAKAITAAAKTAPRAEDDGDDGASEEETRPPPKKEREREREREEEKPAEETSAPPPPPRVSSDDERERRRAEEAAEEAAARSVEPERDQDLEQEGRKIKNRIGPKGISLWLAGTTTWRYYCARPGVSSCGEYDKLIEEKMATPPGDVVDFQPKVPYAGFNFHVELFPLAWFLDNFLQGVGVVGSFGLGFSLTKVKISSGAGQTPEKEVVSTDRSWMAMLAYRFYFSFDSSAKTPAIGYVGIRAGMSGRIFEIDAKAMVPLPGANRIYPTFALDFAIPIMRYFGVEGSASYFVSPRPGPDEIAGYGDAAGGANGGATGTGFQLEGGFAGTIWGPVGYRLRVRYSPFTDRFFGVGNKWTYQNPDGSEYIGTKEGAAFESYVTFIWGITASF